MWSLKKPKPEKERAKWWLLENGESGKGQMLCTAIYSRAVLH